MYTYGLCTISPFSSHYTLQLQYWCVQNIFSILPISSYAYAYIRGKSIKQHAAVHVKSRFILHLDITNFFESITNRHISDVIMRNKDLYKNINIEALIDDICKISLRNDKLCIGSVCSPVISNVIMNNFDIEVSKYCESKRLKYTRYADDIYISSLTFIDTDILEYIKVHLEKMGFSINMKKTRFMSSKNRKTVTGITITHDKQISVGTDMHNKIKSMVYNKIVKGVGNTEKIMGYLSYIKDIEPLFYNKIITKYSKYGNVIDEINKPEK